MNIIFDYDGTLHDTAYIYCRGFQKAYDYLALRGYAQPKKLEESKITGYLGVTPVDAWKSEVPEIDEKALNKAVKITGDEMARLVRLGKSKLYDNVTTTLEFLKEKDHRLIILSNCTSEYRKLHMESFQLDRYFYEFYAAESFGYIPKHEIFNTIRSDFPGNYAVVGDRYADLEVAFKHNLLSIGCLYGFPEKGELDDANYLITDISELIKIL